MLTFLIAGGAFLVFAVALSLGALLGGRTLQGGSCRRTRQVMGESHAECCGAHAECEKLKAGAKETAHDCEEAVGR